MATRRFVCDMDRNALSGLRFAAWSLLRCQRPAAVHRADFEPRNRNRQSVSLSIQTSYAIQQQRTSSGCLGVRSTNKSSASSSCCEYTELAESLCTLWLSSLGCPGFLLGLLGGIAGGGPWLVEGAMAPGVGGADPLPPAASKGSKLPALSLGICPAGWPIELVLALWLCPSGGGLLVRAGK